jgi:hypothetical protein
MGSINALPHTPLCPAPQKEVVKTRQPPRSPLALPLCLVMKPCPQASPANLPTRQTRAAGANLPLLPKPASHCDTRPPSPTTHCDRILNGIHQRVTVDPKKHLAERTS